MKSRDNKPISISGFNRNSELADELSGFYLRFDNGPKSNFWNERIHLSNMRSENIVCREFKFNTHSMRTMFRKG